jgi:peptidyl-prolyl cis-trans isomerase-like protein 2
MGKKSASKDRGYITATEWKLDGGGYRDKTEGLPFRRLPFNCCAVSFVPFEDPVCAPDGTVMDIMHAVPYVQKHGKHPVTGEPLELKDLTKLTFHKNQEGAYECPVLNKAFTNSTHIVAVKTTGNVYSHQAIEELCVKPKNWRDLLTDEKFTRKDLVTIQDPMNLDARALEKFEHVKKGHDATADATAARAESNVNQTGVSADVRRVLEKLGTADATAALHSGGGGRKAQAERELAAAKQKAAAGDDEEKKKTLSSATEKPDTSHLLRGPSPASHPLDNVRFRPGSHTWNTDGETAHDAASDAEKRRQAAQEKMRAGDLYGSVAETRVNAMRTTGAGSTSFTSTVMAHVGGANARAVEAVVRNPKKKGYARVKTNLGDLNLELHCDVAPRTCENFIALARAGYYDGVGFHRSVKNFMVQGGDPTGTGRGGQSVWGGTFKDEITHLKHSGRGVVSMANSGAHTNGSQFFVCYKSAAHLDGKHSVFRRGGGRHGDAREDGARPRGFRRPTEDRDRHRVRGGVRGPVRGRRARGVRGGGEETRGRREGRARAPGSAQPRPVVVQPGGRSRAEPPGMHRSPKRAEAWGSTSPPRRNGRRRRPRAPPSPRKPSPGGGTGTSTRGDASRCAAKRFFFRETFLFLWALSFVTRARRVRSTRQ